MRVRGSLFSRFPQPYTFASRPLHLSVGAAPCVPFPLSMVLGEGAYFARRTQRAAPLRLGLPQGVERTHQIGHAVAGERVAMPTGNDGGRKLKQANG